MKNLNIKRENILPHIIAFVLFVLLVVVYFKPCIFNDLSLQQGDMMSFEGNIKETKDYTEKTGEFVGWTGSAFSGMPTTSIWSYPAFKIFDSIQKVGTLGFDYLSSGIVMLSLLCAYIAFLTLGLSTIISIIGAICLTFTSYNFIIIEAGHVTKAYAIGAAILAFSGMLICLKDSVLKSKDSGSSAASKKPSPKSIKNLVFGGIVTLFGVGLLIAANHVQIAYYIMLCIAILWLVYLVFAIKEKTLKAFSKASVVLVCAGVLAVLPSAATMMPSYEYAKDTMRGGHVLEQSEDEANKDSKGLDIDYAFSWSYGIGESFTLLIPNFYGGSSSDILPKSSPLVQKYRIPRAPTYWGAQPFTSGPVYAGAIVCFLFILGLFVIKGREKWWILISICLALVMSWGKNLMFINEILFYHLPLYSKFRTPSMSLIVVTLLMGLMSVLTLREIIVRKDKNSLKKPILYSTGICGGICFIFLAFGGSILSFSAAQDASLQWPADAIESLRQTRAQMLRQDSLRSLILVAIALGLLWCYISGKLKEKFVLGILCGVMLIDLWMVDKRYLNDDSFSKKANTFVAQDYNLEILQDKDPNFRVFNATSNTFNDAVTSYFHKSIGGYSPVKLRRYQDIIDFHFSKKLNVRVLNMLNTKYFIAPSNAGPVVQRNVAALGNAWFVDNIKWVNTNREEIEALYDFAPEKEAVVHSEFKDCLANFEGKTGASDAGDAAEGRAQAAAAVASDGVASEAEPSLVLGHADSENKDRIKFISYAPNHLVYEYTAKKERLAVFSEIYFPKEWKAYIDGVEASHFRCNYILRAMLLPEGEHKVEFKHFPYHQNLWAGISTGSSILVVIVLLLGLAYYINIRRNAKGGN